jgi:peptidoglycan/xylan/chitin deacetylase (PgdA/CDA1 family)
LNPTSETSQQWLIKKFGLLIFLVFLLGIMLGIEYLLKPVVSRQIAIPIESKRAESSVEIVRGNHLKRQVIFTFDGGSGAQSTEKILITLRKYNVRGTFFLTGKFVEKYPDLVREIVAGGHEVFNHTYDHQHLPLLSDREIISELDQMERALRRVGGVSSAPYFRAPYGDRDSRVLSIAFKAGYQSVYWGVDARDWMEDLGTTAEEVRTTILSNIYPGAIFLLHLGDNISGQILDDVFLFIKSQGYDIVPLSKGVL